MLGTPPRSPLQHGSTILVRDHRSGTRLEVRHLLFDERVSSCGVSAAILETRWKVLTVGVNAEQRGARPQERAHLSPERSYLAGKPEPQLQQRACHREQCYGSAGLDDVIHADEPSLNVGGLAHGRAGVCRLEPNVAVEGHDNSARASGLAFSCERQPTPGNASTPPYARLLSRPALAAATASYAASRRLLECVQQRSERKVVSCQPVRGCYHGAWAASTWRFSGRCAKPRPRRSRTRAQGDVPHEARFRSYAAPR